MNQGFTTSGTAHPPEYTIEQMDNMITALADNGDLRNGYRVTFPIRAIYAGKVLRFQVKVLKQKASAIEFLVGSDSTMKISSSLPLFIFRKEAILSLDSSL